MSSSDTAHKRDAELVVLSLRDQQYFAELVERYQDKLSRYVRRISSANDQDIEDILQDVFIKVYQNLNAYDDTYSFSSWIYRITHNHTISVFRKKSRKKELFTLDGTEGQTLIDKLASDEDVEAALDSKITSGVLRGAIDALDEKYKDVLVLRYLEERDYKDIAFIMQKPSGTVATLLNRAKKQLRKHIEKHQLPLE